MCFQQTFPFRLFVDVPFFLLHYYRFVVFGKETLRRRGHSARGPSLGAVRCVSKRATPQNATKHPTVVIPANRKVWKTQIHAKNRKVWKTQVPVEKHRKYGRPNLQPSEFQWPKSKFLGSIWQTKRFLCCVTNDIALKIHHWANTVLFTEFSQRMYMLFLLCVGIPHVPFSPGQSRLKALSWRQSNKKCRLGIQSASIALHQWSSTFFVQSPPYRNFTWKPPLTYNFCNVWKYYFVLQIIQC